MGMFEPTLRRTPGFDEIMNSLTIVSINGNPMSSARSDVNPEFFGHPPELLWCCQVPILRSDQ